MEDRAVAVGDWGWGGWVELWGVGGLSGKGDVGWGLGVGDFEGRV